MRYLLLALCFVLIIPVVVALPLGVTIVNSAPVLDAQYVVTQPLPPTILYIEDFSYDPDRDNYTCHYSFTVNGDPFTGSSCIIYHPFTNITYTMTITLNDSVNVSVGVIDVIINTLIDTGGIA